MEITIPTTIIKLGNYCFNECLSLTSINISISIIEIGKYCFFGCTSLTNINIENIKFIGENKIFINEPVLISFEMPERLNSINNKEGNHQTTDDFIIPTTITKLGDYCFSGCVVLCKITIPTSVSEIGYRCFSECSFLSSIDIPTTVSEIGDDCFLKSPYKPRIK
ncbi:leucine rich repeat protein, BspA family protein [Entamoeba histolytica HM-1:IMSS-B]|uniref:Leucine rich repeat protein bspa family n=6 Tax=Entamoeba histolytica TaxID=5759 RepID=C4M7H2_ENTH1|nr:hypothetical protein EHI_111960 [Entamoeba histolytica HM-1:IMSS]EMD43813.1 leucine rich repeatcontaining protein [Entamoeba histolytica KU27]EMH72493.1 leucine rich repeat protein, BspA family protein [Entamoeba histolytica HM-1:IMSS-B]EMS16341.1 leucine rich repeat protein 1, putative [Entamoeba histolytica HM-3:IMSS]ENY60985.1 leucine rich repeat protein 1 [Entamoeba histolytica HM-1:IMSS-A]GAT97481.1 leucine rich repeat protein bspa family [Entamoeba histolytica]|eukprot:XP_648451.1 hypothetical protein EHI_111960 [Entamoeba histolytica HM-1:IMSS]